jgi:hypothetical protein
LRLASQRQLSDSFPLAFRMLVPAPQVHRNLVNLAAAQGPSKKGFGLGGAGNRTGQSQAQSEKKGTGSAI